MKKQKAISNAALIYGGKVEPKKRDDSSSRLNTKNVKSLAKSKDKSINKTNKPTTKKEQEADAAKVKKDKLRRE